MVGESVKFKIAECDWIHNGIGSQIGDSTRKVGQSQQGQACFDVRLDGAKCVADKPCVYQRFRRKVASLIDGDAN